MIATVYWHRHNRQITPCWIPFYMSWKYRHFTCKVNYELQNCRLLFVTSTKMLLLQKLGAHWPGARAWFLMKRPVRTVTRTSGPDARKSLSCNAFSPSGPCVRRPASANRWPVHPGRTDEQGTNHNSTCHHYHHHLLSCVFIINMTSLLRNS